MLSKLFRAKVVVADFDDTLILHYCGKIGINVGTTEYVCGTTLSYLKTQIPTMLY